MKKIYYMSAVVIFTFTHLLLADVIIIDSTTGNGGFENGTDETFDGTDNWYNTGTTVTVPDICRRTAADMDIAPITGEYSAYLRRTWAGDVPVITQATGYTIQDGDIFTFSIDAEAAWGADVGADSVRVNLFTYTDPEKTASVWVTSMDFVLTSTDWTHYTFTSAAITSSSKPEVIGQELYVRIMMMSSSGESAFVDNLEVSVVPEPATAGLFGVASLALLAFRRMWM